MTFTSGLCLLIQYLAWILTHVSRVYCPVIVHQIIVSELTAYISFICQYWVE